MTIPLKAVESISVDWEGKDPWERMRGEPVRAFNAFCIYRDLGPDRTIRQASELVKKTDTKGVEHKVSVFLLNKWSAKFKWRLRLLAWAENEDLIKRRARQVQIEEMEKRHVEFANLVQKKANIKFTSMTDDDCKRLSAKDATTMAEMAIKVERQSLGVRDELPAGLLTQEQALMLYTALVDAVAMHVKDKVVLAALMQEFDALTSGRKLLRVVDDGQGNQVVQGREADVSGPVAGDDVIEAGPHS